MIPDDYSAIVKSGKEGKKLMPLTRSIQIVVIRFKDTDVPELPPQYQIHLVEQPPQKGSGYKLFSEESMPWNVTGGGPRLTEIPLTPQNSQRLAHLVDELPCENMFSKRLSFDGCDYRLLVIQPGASLEFQWSNEDWRCEPEEFHERWQKVSALADTLITLIQDHSPKKAIRT